MNAVSHHWRIISLGMVSGVMTTVSKAHGIPVIILALDRLIKHIQLMSG